MNLSLKFHICRITNSKYFYYIFQFQNFNMGISVEFENRNYSTCCLHFQLFNLKCFLVSNADEGFTFQQPHQLTSSN